MSAGEPAAGRLRVPRSGVVLLAMMSGALVVADGAWMLFRFGGVEVTSFVDGLGAILAGVAGTVLPGMRARVEPDPGERAGWLILSISCAAFVAGVLVAVAYVAVTGAGPPVPSVLGLVGVLFLGGRLWGGSRIRLLLDGGIVTCAILLLSWLTALHAAYQAGGHGLPSFAVGLTYPIGDVVTVVIVLAVVSHSRRLSPALVLVALGMLLFALSDSAFAYLHYQRPKVLDDGYVAGYLLIAIAGLTRRDLQGAADRLHLTRWQVVIPYIPLALAAVAVVVALGRDQPLDPLTKVLVAAMVLFVLARQLAAVAEARSLTARRADALQGRSFLDFVHPDDTEVGVRGLVDLQTQDLERVDVEIRGVRPDGSTLWCSATVGPLKGPTGAWSGRWRSSRTSRNASGRPSGRPASSEGCCPKARPRSRATRWPAPAGRPSTWPVTSTTGSSPRTADWT